MIFHWWMIPIGYINIGFLFLAWQAWKVGKHLSRAHLGDPKSPCTDMDNEFGCAYTKRGEQICIALFLWPLVVLCAPFYYWYTFWTYVGRNMNLPPLNAHPGGEAGKTRGVYVPYGSPGVDSDGSWHDMKVGPCACGAWHKPGDRP